MDRIGLREFQLFLLSLMAPSVRVEQGLRQLNASEDALERAKAAVLNTQLTKLPHSIGLEELIFGHPTFSGAFDGAIGGLAPISDSEGANGIRAARFTLPIFEHFDYEVQVHSSKLVVGWRLSRSLSSTPPILQGFHSLSPWSHVKPEILPFLENVELVDGFGHWEILNAVLVVNSNSRQRIGLRFVYELLQDAWILK